MKRIFSTVCFSVIFLSTWAQSVYQLDQKSSFCSWKGSAVLGAYSIEGSLVPASGSLLIKTHLLMEGELIMDMKSLKTEIKDAEKHLRKDDFFNVKQFPQASFVLTESVPWQEGLGTVTGLIEIKGVTKTMQVPIKVKKEKDVWVMKGLLVLDRTAFGITYNSPSLTDQLQEHAISDEIEFIFELRFRQN